MNTSPVSEIKSTAGRRHRVLASFLTAALILAGVTGCNTTQQVRQSSKDFSGFLGDYSQLQPGQKGEPNFIYSNPDAPWQTYAKVCIRPVELWKSPDSSSSIGSLSPDDQQMLVNALHTALAGALNRNFILVDQPGPGVLVLHAAITDAGASKPVMNLLSTVIPVSRVINAGKTAVTGKGTGVGSFSVEAEISDGATGRRVLAMVDSRAGTKALRTKFSGSWGDAYQVFDFWSQELDARLVALKSGL